MNEQTTATRKKSAEREEIRKTGRQLKMDEQRKRGNAARWDDPEEQLKEFDARARDLDKFRD